MTLEAITGIDLGADIVETDVVDTATGHPDLSGMSCELSRDYPTWRLHA